MKYKIDVSGVYKQFYIIEADSQEQAGEKLSDGDYLKEGDMYYSNEQIEQIWELNSLFEYARKLIKEERISYGEIAELQALKDYIDPSDTLLLQWAGVEETK